MTGQKNVTGTAQSNQGHDAMLLLPCHARVPASRSGFAEDGPVREWASAAGPTDPSQAAAPRAGPRGRRRRSHPVPQHRRRWPPPAAASPPPYHRRRPHPLRQQRAAGALRRS